MNAHELVEKCIWANQTLLINGVLNIGDQDLAYNNVLLTRDLIKNREIAVDWKTLRDEEQDTFWDFVTDNPNLISDGYPDDYENWQRGYEGDVDDADINAFMDWLIEGSTHLHDHYDVLNSLELDEDDIETWIDYARRNDLLDDGIEEWWLIDPVLVHHLLNEKEAVLHFAGNCWWGRRASGSAIADDSVIQKLVEVLARL